MFLYHTDIIGVVIVIVYIIYYSRCCDIFIIDLKLCNINYYEFSTEKCEIYLLRKNQWNSFCSLVYRLNLWKPDVNE